MSWNIKQVLAKDDSLVQDSLVRVTGGLSLVSLNSEAFATELPARRKLSHQQSNNKNTCQKIKQYYDA